LSWIFLLLQKKHTRLKSLRLLSILLAVLGIVFYFSTTFVWSAIALIFVSRLLEIGIFDDLCRKKQLSSTLPGRDTADSQSGSETGAK
jgi:hypothetical protein